tara:strand:+ start:395 stop:604 length:210 start_codon:yes stop_codon:yes gene_type:complete
MANKKNWIVSNDLLQRYNKLPKEAQAKITFEEFIKEPNIVELKIDTIKNIAIGRQSILLYAKQGKRGYY